MITELFALATVAVKNRVKPVVKVVEPKRKRRVSVGVLKGIEIEPQQNRKSQEKSHPKNNIVELHTVDQQVKVLSPELELKEEPSHEPELKEALNPEEKIIEEIQRSLVALSDPNPQDKSKPAWITKSDAKFITSVIPREKFEVRARELYIVNLKGKGVNRRLVIKTSEFGVTTEELEKIKEYFWRVCSANVRNRDAAYNAVGAVLGKLNALFSKVAVDTDVVRDIAEKEIHKMDLYSAKVEGPLSIQEYYE